jgi:hypothetical protein
VNWRTIPDDPVGYTDSLASLDGEQDGMRTVLLGLLGLVLGAAAGSWLGLMSGLVYAELAKISCFEGYCGYVAAAFALVGAAGLGIGGAFIGVRRALGRSVTSPAPSRAARASFR